MLADSQRRKKILSDEIKNINDQPLQVFGKHALSETNLVI